MDGAVLAIVFFSSIFVEILLLEKKYSWASGFIWKQFFFKSISLKPEYNSKVKIMKALEDDADYKLKTLKENDLENKDIEEIKAKLKVKLILSIAFWKGSNFDRLLCPSPFVVQGLSTHNFVLWDTFLQTSFENPLV